MIIPFPFALWTFSLFADVMYIWRGNQSWERTAFYTLAGGIAGGIAAAIPGIIDYFGIKDRTVSKLAGWHARFNVLALLLFAVSFYLRTRTGGAYMANGDYTLPVALSAVGFILICISGWLGGDMVYKHGVAVNPQNDARAEERAKARAS
jgi:uncharacterized membrane protein